MAKSTPTVKQVVEKILKKNKIARDDDKVLWFEYMNQTQGLEEKIGKKAYATLIDEFTKAPSFDSTRRARAQFQEAGLYLGKKRKASK